MFIPDNCIPNPGKQYSGSGFSSTIWNHNKLFYYSGNKNIKIDIPETLIQIQVQQQIAPPQIKITQLTDEEIAKLEKDKNAKASVSTDTLEKINKEKSDKITPMKPSSADVSQPTDVKETSDNPKDEKQNDEMSQLTERSISEYISTRNIPQLIKFKDTAGIPGIKPDQLNPDDL